MALFIARETAHGGGFLPLQVIFDLGVIVNGDGGIGQNDNPADNRGIEVTYDRGDSGIPAQRIDDFVNNIAAPIIIGAVNATYVMSDGTSILSFGGTALPPNDPWNWNPSTEIMVIYDSSECDGTIWWVDGESGNQLCLNSSTILYHELSHALRIANGTINWGDMPNEERLANIDTNVLHDQMGIEHRVENSHNGGCGCTGAPITIECCVVASLATGGLYSATVNEMRRLRDHFLRIGRAGEDFFDHLHYEYYAFSPEVCRLMVKHKGLKGTVRDSFVTPLLYALQMIRQYVGNSGDGLSNLVAQQIRETEFGDSFVRDRIRIMMMRYYLGRIANLERNANISVADAFGLAGLEGMDELVGYVTEYVPRSTYLKWGMIEVVDIWSEAVEMLLAGRPEAEVQLHLRNRISAWSTEFPISSMWGQMEAQEFANALKSLDIFFIEDVARKGFGRRLAQAYPQRVDIINEWAGLSNE